MRHSKKVLRNVFSNWTGLGINIVLSFFLSPFVVHKLGMTYYGIWVILIQFSGYLGLLEVGVRSSVIRYVAKYRAEGDVERLNKTVSSALSLYIVLAGICLSVIGPLVYFFPKIFHLSGESESVAQAVVVLTGVGVAQGLIFNVFFGVLMGIQRYDIFNKINIAVSIVKALMTVILLSSGYGIVALSINQLVLGMISNLVAMSRCRREIPELRILLFQTEKSFYRTIYNYSIISLIIQISIRIIYYTDSLVIGIYLGAPEVAFFAVAGNLVEYLRRLLSMTTQVLNPLASELESKKESHKIKDVLILGTKFSLLIGLPICSVYAIMGENFIGLWMGPEFAEKSGAILLILTVTHLFSVAQYTTGNILYGISRHKVSAICHGAEAVANLALSIILVNRMGVIGVAIGTAIPHLAVVAVAFPIIISRIVGLSLKEYVRESYLLPFLSVIPFATGCYLVEKYFRAESLHVFFGTVLGLLPLYILTVWFLCFKKEERSGYISLLSQMIPARGRQ